MLLRNPALWCDLSETRVAADECRASGWAGRSVRLSNDDGVSQCPEGLLVI